MIIALRTQFHAFNQEKALVGAFSVIRKLRMELFEALLSTPYTLHPVHDTYIIKSTCHGGGGGHVSRVTRRHQLTFCTVARITLVTGHSGHAGGTTRKWSDAAHAFTSHCPPAHTPRSVCCVLLNKRSSGQHGIRLINTALSS